LNQSAAKRFAFAIVLAVGLEVSPAVPGSALSARVGGREGPADSPGGTGDIKRIVQALEARYQSASTLKAAFLERYSEGGRVVRVESGTAYFSRPGRMRWEYESPEQKLFVADGKTVWFYVPADRTVSRAKTKESEDWRTPLALLTGKAKLSRLCSRIELAEAAAPVAPLADGDVILRCLPRGAANGSRARESHAALTPRQNAASGAPAGSDAADFLEVFLEVNPLTAELSRVVVRETAGVEMEFRFGNWQRNPPLAESLFHFQAPIGVAIVEESTLSNSPH